MKIGRNAIWNIGEIAAATLTLFLLFKIIVGALGLGALGVWSLVLATTSMARLADLGVTGGLGKFVAQATARRDQGGGEASPLAYVETAVTANLVLYAVIAAIAFWPAREAVLAVLEGAEAREAAELLPYALLSLVFGAMSGTLGAGLLGLNRSDQKSQIMMAGYGLQLLAAVVLAPRYGLPGVAIGQILQHLFVAAAAWFMIGLQLNGRVRTALPLRISLPLLRPLVSYGLRLQGVTLASFFYEPVVKFLIAGAGGAAALGLFEMAFRLITQSRQFLAAPCQNLLPLYVRATEGGGGVGEIYRTASFIVTLFAGLGLALLVWVTPWISQLWIGRVEPVLTIYVTILAVGWFLNMAAIPAFYLGMSSGHLRWNILGSGATTLTALLAGLALGERGGPTAVVLASSLAAGVGAILIAIGNTRTAGVPLTPSPSSIVGLLTAAYRRFKRSV